MLGIYPEKKNNLKIYMYPNAQSSTIFSNKDMEAT